ncbi:MAG: hypothetical protein ABIG93_03230 [archaeon]|nr:hypothetical protein [Nanoarchaeota archaeon]
MAKKVAFGFDIDECLTLETGQNPILRHYMSNITKKYPHITDVSGYWKLCNDSNFKIAWMQQFARDAPEIFPGLDNKVLREIFAPQIPLAPGVETWFDRMKEYCKELGLEVGFHAISASAIPLIEGLPFAHHFDSIYAGEFHEENGVICRVKNTVGPHDKVRRLKHIAKGLDKDIYDDLTVDQYDVEYHRFLIFGDGLSDRDMFRYFHEDGAHVTAVFDPINPKAYVRAKKRLTDHVNVIVPRDYQEGSRLEKETKRFLEGIANRECDMDHDLVHRMILGQLRSSSVEVTVRKHYESCEYCQERRETKIFVN